MKKIFVSILLMVTTTLVNAQTFIQPDEDGLLLKIFYEGLHVDSLWLAGKHVDWQTGVADSPLATKNIKTHCSSFVAAACLKKGVYILRPPQHKVTLLANAQYDWLHTNQAEEKGWKQITDSIFLKAQTLSNAGYLVVAVYKNTHPKKPGHIALVMPSVEYLDDLYSQGPCLIQAGSINSCNIHLRQGFKSHVKQWDMATTTVQFFYNTKK